MDDGESAPLARRRDAGVLQVTRLGPQVLLIEVRGHLDLELALELTKQAQSMLERQGRVHVFHDWEAVTGYDAAGQVELTRCMIANRGRFLSAHLLASEPAVAFGVEVANIVLRERIALHRDRASFAAALRREASA